MQSKNYHEIRDPIHVFIRLSTKERLVLDSRPMQRLRDIHQLALTYQVYPGATHRRFEHSLGVMELSSRIFDVVTNPDNVEPQINLLLPDLRERDHLPHWRRALRMAALCHDIGHLPFSHAAEDELLPSGWKHEQITRALIESDELRSVWKQLNIEPELIVKLALGKKHARDLEFSDWESVLSEIIVSDVFGADRMDYLLRDSYHAGVAYGRFDHFRLIDTLRILPQAPSFPGDTEQSLEPSLGVEEGGLQSAEALLLARYSMYSQVYMHRIRRIYDIHLKDFLRQWLSGGQFPVDPARHLEMSDSNVLTALWETAAIPGDQLHELAQRVVGRSHFRPMYSPSPNDLMRNNDAAKVIFNAACAELGEASCRLDSYQQRGSTIDFPVMLMDATVASARSLSQVMQHLPTLRTACVYVSKPIVDRALKWLGREKTKLLSLVP